MGTTRAILVSVALAATLGAPGPADARHRARHARARPAEAAALPPARAPARKPDDDLYRRRGYGMGGPLFGGNIGEAGTCAELAFADPASCGAKGGIGVYGNGLTYPFGR